MLFFDFLLGLAVGGAGILFFLVFAAILNATDDYSLRYHQLLKEHAAALAALDDAQTAIRAVTPEEDADFPRPMSFVSCQPGDEEDEGC